MKNAMTWVVLTLALIAVGCETQYMATNEEPKRVTLSDDNDTLRIMSYNIENFFHPDNDALKNDDDFTPEGKMHWSYGRMRAKAARLSRVIMSACGSNRPQIVGLCEIEGPHAAHALLVEGGLDNVGYNVLCEPTPDQRGIATALLYDERKVEVISHKAIYSSDAEHGLLTRDVLYAKVRVKADLFHIMMNHWPSKYGGEFESAWKRDTVAQRVRRACDSIKAIEPEANIVLIGDFNDDSHSTSLTQTLGAAQHGKPLVLLTNDTEKQSYKYKGVWSSIDHAIVSDKLVEHFGRPQFSICDMPFLLTNDTPANGGGLIPLRTYKGQSHQDGYSDHLPILIKIPLR